jgi:hypothetical protein
VKLDKTTRLLAELLAAVLGPYVPEALAKTYVHPWILVWEACGNLPEAIRVAGHDIADTRAEIEAGDLAPYPRLLLSPTEYLRDSLTFQAERYLKVGNKAKARDCLHEVAALSERYGLRPDEDVQVLFQQMKEASLLGHARPPPHRVVEFTVESNALKVA